MQKRLALFVSACLSAAAHAHEGHGLPGLSHWHATDTLGFIAGAVGVAAVAWWINRNR